MINLSAFGYEKDMRIQDIIPETWKRKDFIQGQMVQKFEQDFSRDKQTIDNKQSTYVI